MFESSPSSQHADSGLSLSAESSSIESILRNSGLPAAVKAAPLTQVFERMMDEKELRRITTPIRVHQEGSDHVERLQVRTKALSEYLGSTLTCVLIRLPGVAYTIEIDLDAAKIVHWEWQRA